MCNVCLLNQQILVRIFFSICVIFLSHLGFSPSGRFAKNVKGRKIFAFMEKINYRKQELDLVDRLLQIVESGANSNRQVKQVGRVTEPATAKQLGLLAKLGIYPKWEATRKEAEEMIIHYKLILATVKPRPL